MLAWDDAGHVLAVDSGPIEGAEALVGALDELGVHRVALWVHTHYDADHVGGLYRALRGPDGDLRTPDDIELVGAWDRGTTAVADTVATRAYFAAVGDLRRGVEPGDAWREGALAVRVLSPTPPTGGTIRENDRGIALCVEVGDLRVFVPGDLPSERQLGALEGCDSPDVVWAAHHGAADGSSAALAEAVGPEAVVVVSAGSGNVHCHPSPGSLAVWRAHEALLLDVASVRRTGTCGEIVSSLGPRHRVESEDPVFPATPSAAP